VGLFVTQKGQKSATLWLCARRVIQSPVVRETIATFLRRALRLLLAVIALLARSWRLWLAAALLGALLLAAHTATEPRRWASEGEIALRPRILRQGYLLSTRELTANYALRLREESRVARVLDMLGLDEDPQQVTGRVTTWTEPAAGMLYLRVEDADPARAEAITRALMVDFRDELEAENRTRQELDRLVISLSPTSFARPANPPLIDSILRGFGAGLALGLTLALLRGWLNRGRVRAPIEVEQLIGAPTLAAIPRRQ
jgi:capsular polysaccharide biosynthesis protein